MAAKIAQQLHATSTEIIPVRPYPANYQQTLTVTKNELDQKRFPDIKPIKIDFHKEKNLFLGFPNWWSTIPRPVATFLKSQSLENVHIYPFCTHEGSQFGYSRKDIQLLAPNAVIHQGLPIRGVCVGQADQAIQNWLSTINL
ncbi:hypothetical protein IV38_GL001523 [Lactobacillus selangorensis]|nr:hypothetical protein IV38_GL001523 [Lactobacillus selangorensis]